jgi:hypothetical protein
VGQQDGGAQMRLLRNLVGSRQRYDRCVTWFRGAATVIAALCSVAVFIAMLLRIAGRFHWM